ncbi:MAG TPA: flagellar biosynthesis protein FlgE, partial [Desulfovibrio sp.]|nr:flagellar biosynthesis protein FlgE [Desulfovibrio sp.]
SPKNLYMYSAADPANANLLADFTEPAVIEAYASTNLDGAFSSSNAQNGYGFGDLTSWEVDSDGILNGVYSNGVTLPLWQITMYDFVNTQGLRREGNNLYSETRASGYPKMGAAGNSGLGDIASYTLEQSNVDLATEMVYMISTQRGYQSNSKMVTTVDTMLETVINMKR